MFEVLPLLRGAMSASGSWRSALFLTILMILIGPSQMNGEILAKQPISEELTDIKTPSMTAVGAETFVGLNGDNQVNTGFTVDVPSMEPILRNN